MSLWSVIFSIISLKFWPFFREVRSITSLTVESKKNLEILDQQVLDVREEIEYSEKLSKKMQRIFFLSTIFAVSICLLCLWLDVAYALKTMESDPVFYLSSSVKRPQRSLFSILLLIPVDFLVNHGNSTSRRRELPLSFLFFEWFLFFAIFPFV